jgi:hypothetical protein
MTRAEYKQSYRRATYYSWSILLVGLSASVLVAAFRAPSDENRSVLSDLTVGMLAVALPITLIYAVCVTIGWGICTALDKAAPLAEAGEEDPLK